MKVYQTNEIKNIALLGNDGAGKTTLTEALLFESGIIKRRGRITAKNTVSAFPPPGDLSNPGIRQASLMSPAMAGRFFTTSATWEACENSEKSVICSLEERYWQSDLGSPASGTERNKCLLFRSHVVYSILL